MKNGVRKYVVTVQYKWTARLAPYSNYYQTFYRDAILRYVKFILTGTVNHFSMYFRLMIVIRMYLHMYRTFIMEYYRSDTKTFLSIVALK